MRYEEPEMEIIVLYEQIVTLSNGGIGDGDSGDFDDLFNQTP